MELKTCTKCNITKDILNFNKRKTGTNGKNSICRDCEKLRREANKEKHNAYRVEKWAKDPSYRQHYLNYHKNRYLDNRDTILAYKDLHYSIPENKLKHMISAAKARAIKANIEFNITKDDVIIPEYCAYLGIKLTSKTKCGRLDSAMSLDRIEPSKGYTKDNVMIISDLANRMKQNATKEQLITFAENILKLYKGN